MPCQLHTRFVTVAITHAVFCLGTIQACRHVLVLISRQRANHYLLTVDVIADAIGEQRQLVILAWRAVLPADIHLVMGFRFQVRVTDPLRVAHVCVAREVALGGIGHALAAAGTGKQLVILTRYQGVTQEGTGKRIVAIQVAADTVNRVV